MCVARSTKLAIQHAPARGGTKPIYSRLSKSIRLLHPMLRRPLYKSLYDQLQIVFRNLQRLFHRTIRLSNVRFQSAQISHDLRHVGLRSTSVTRIIVPTHDTLRGSWYRQEEWEEDAVAVAIELIGTCCSVDSVQCRFARDVGVIFGVRDCLVGCNDERCTNLEMFVQPQFVWKAKPLKRLCMAEQMGHDGILFFLQYRKA